MKKIIIVALFGILLARPEISLAANARDYIPLPDNTMLFCTYFKHMSANTLFANGKKVSNDFNLTANLGIFRPVYYTNIGNALYGDGGFTVDPQALIVFGQQELDGDATGNKDLSDTGLADSTVLATFWFVNAPKDKFWVGFSPYITMPIGHYNQNRTFNLGKNRWAFKPELGIVKGFGEKFYADFIVNGEFYTDNNDFYNGVTQVKMSQDPVLGIETHLSYDITKQWYISLDYFYNYGGETKVAGIKQKDELNNHGLGVSLFWMVGSNNQLMIEYRNDFSVKSGPGADTFGARWAYFF
jgi:hypothetical protein